MVTFLFTILKTARNSGTCYSKNELMIIKDLKFFKLNFLVQSFFILLVFYLNSVYSSCPGSYSNVLLLLLRPDTRLQIWYFLLNFNTVCGHLSFCSIKSTKNFNAASRRSSYFFHFICVEIKGVSVLLMLITKNKNRYKFEVRSP